MILDRAQVERLTGFKRKSAQIRELTRRGYSFEIDGKGYPIVLESVVQARLGKQQTRRTQPRWERLGTQAQT